ncbi:hypothetical protein LZ24_01843 [Desulfobotulus alkaliphilus]|uniref:Uncharacterized protein n=1 Tax=Desulfobotulus alkaliphilus TaxID=622671 RepID=A0A562RTZ8_9BACT|nr:hypothetical protein [Desulfobotulus alkaliphilus]TWI71826.1 hypothetical protein LZ24_01843 [Desulfobotulus alkaliphilus]
MFKKTFMGGLLLVGGLFFLLLKGIAGFMEMDFEAADLTLEAMIPAERLAWVDRLPWEILQTAADAVLLAPLYVLLIAMGIFLLILGGIMDK